MKRQQHSSKEYSRRTGQGLVEFALVAPLLLILIIGILEAGWLIRNSLMISNGAREGARAASLARTTSEISSRVQSSVQPLVVAAPGGSIAMRYSMNGGADNFSYVLSNNNTQNNAPVGSFIKITASTRHRSLTGLFPFLSRDVRFAVTMRREAV